MQEKIDKVAVDKAYEPLRDFMFKKYGLELESFDLSFIVDRANEVNENLRELMRIKCDVEGCDAESVSGGVCWPETGYWAICGYHASWAKRDTAQPTMKPEAIQREANRKPDGTIA